MIIGDRHNTIGNDLLVYPMNLMFYGWSIIVFLTYILVVKVENLFGSLYV